MPRTSADRAAASEDTFIVEGEVVTMDAARPCAEAVAVREGRIAAVGTSPEVRAAMGGDAPVVALGGASVLPGFIDAHHHYCFAAFNRRTPDLHHHPDTPMQALLLRIEEVAAQRSQGWVRCQGTTRESFGRGARRGSTNWTRSAPTAPCSCAPTRAMRGV